METIAVTVSVGNGGQDGIVMDTQTIILNEAGETSGVFRSGSVVLTDTKITGIASSEEMPYKSKITPTEFWSIAFIAIMAMIFIFYVLFRRSNRRYESIDQKTDG